MQHDEITLIPIDHIRIINPRSRNKKSFTELIESIQKVGLKRPITVASSGEADASGEIFNLLCGQGRLEACQALGETLMPCRIVDANSEESYLISLVENIARRHHSAIELLSGIRILSERGYVKADIARKIGVDLSYINGILLLLDKGEERLINAVEKGIIPINVAISICRTDNQAIQRELSERYQNGELNQVQIQRIRRLIARREENRKRNQNGESVRSQFYTPDKLMAIYEEEKQRQQKMIKQAEYAEKQFYILLNCLEKLFKNKLFPMLLESAQLKDMPKQLAHKLNLLEDK